MSTRVVTVVEYEGIGVYVFMAYRSIPSIVVMHCWWQVITVTVVVRAFCRESTNSSACLEYALWCFSGVSVFDGLISFRFFFSAFPPSSHSPVFFLLHYREIHHVCTMFRGHKHRAHMLSTVVYTVAALNKTCPIR